MTRHGAGVFRRLLHVIEDDWTLDFHGIPLWFSPCGCPCVPIEESRESPLEGAWPPCHPCSVCFPSKEVGVVMAQCAHRCGDEAVTTNQGQQVCQECSDAMDRIANGEPT